MEPGRHRRLTGDVTHARPALGLRALALWTSLPNVGGHGNTVLVDSLDLLFQTVSRERADQLSHFDALDSKAGILLGFAGTLIALSPDVPFPLQVATLLLLVLSAVCAAGAFWPRRMPTLEAEALRGYLRADVEFTMLTLHDTYVVMIQQGSATLSRKVQLVKAAMALLAVAGATLAVAIAIGG